MLEKVLKPGVQLPEEVMVRADPLPAWHEAAEIQTRRLVSWTTSKSTSLFGKTVSESSRTSQFLWLPFAPRAITYVESQGYDVLSGPFSGCLFVSYTRNGGRRVGHVGTTSEGNVEAKVKWTSIKAEQGVNVSREFSPSDPIDLSLMSKLKGGLYVAGLITAENKCFTIACSETNAFGVRTLTVTKVVEVA